MIEFIGSFFIITIDFPLTNYIIYLEIKVLLNNTKKKDWVMKLVSASRLREAGLYFIDEVSLDGSHGSFLEFKEAERFYPPYEKDGKKGCSFMIFEDHDVYERWFDDKIELVILDEGVSLDCLSVEDQIKVHLEQFPNCDDKEEVMYLYPYTLFLGGDDDFSVGKGFLTLNEVVEEVKSLYESQPVDFKATYDYVFTN